MSGIVVPHDRTLKQPTRGFCRNPKCREQSNREFQFTVEHDRFECPKCGANSEPMIGVLTLTHLLLPDRGGPVIGKGGVRYKIACDETRAYLATATNNEAVTDNPAIANCPGCLEIAKSLGLLHGQGVLLVEKAKAKAAEDVGHNGPGRLLSEHAELPEPQTEPETDTAAEQDSQPQSEYESELTESPQQEE